MLTLGACSESEPRTWYNLRRRGDYVTDFVLEGKSHREIEITTSEPLVVGYKTDASRDVYEKYRQQKPPPVQLRQVGKFDAVRNVLGAGCIFKPIDGKLTLVMENGTDVPLKIVIYKRKP